MCLLEHGTAYGRSTTDYLSDPGVVDLAVDISDYATDLAVYIVYGAVDLVARDPTDLFLDLVENAG